MVRVRRRQRARRAMRRFQTAVLCLTVVLLFFWFDQRVGAAAQDTAEYQCQMLCTEAINDAAEQVLREESGLVASLTEVQYSADGEIQHVEMQTENVNLLRLRLTDTVMESLTSLQNQEVSLRLGSLTGVALLFGRGPGIPMRVIPLTSVTSEVRESFEGAGVNQTLHTVSIVVGVDMRVLYGVRYGDVHVETEILVSQSVIAGSVPGGTLQNNLFKYAQLWYTVIDIAAGTGRRERGDFLEFETARKEWAALRDKIEYHNHLYYDLDSPELDDFEYDALTRRIRELEAEFPQLAENSPTQHVGGTASSSSTRCSTLSKWRACRMFSRLKRCVILTGASGRPDCSRNM